MPTYSYRCANCDFSFDQHQSFTDDSLTMCPNCGHAQLRKVFNAIGVSFKGSGFYRTDSRTKPGAKPGKHSNAASSSEKAAVKSGAEKSNSAAPASSSSDSSSSSAPNKASAPKPAASSASSSSGK